MLQLFEMQRPVKPVRMRGKPCSVGLKRAYEPPASGDGMRILIDRLWPRGLNKEQLAIDFWLKDAAPSDALRRWYGHRANRWSTFAANYRVELAGKGDLLRLLDELRRRGRVTLIYGARDTARNNAVVLREVLIERCCAGKRAQGRLAMSASTSWRHSPPRSNPKSRAGRSRRS